MRFIGVLLLAFVSASPRAATLSVDAAKPIRTMDRHRLLGSNVAGWYFPATYDDPLIRKAIRDIGPITLRLPGGSWGDGTFWNGNGVRRGNDVDYSKFNPKPYSPWSAPWGTWKIDYSDYAPGFLVDVKPNDKPRMYSTQWHGHVDVKFMHEFIRDMTCEPFVIVNGGTGSPRDAAEWVRWANLKMGYGVKYWEVGNELGGSWEAGHFLPDGSELNGKIYARRYEEFARAMKAVDPTIKIGTMDWLDDVLAQCGELVDFISIHAYPVGVSAAPGAITDEELFVKLGEIRELMEKHREIIHRHQPKREREIEIAFSEWNMGWPDIRGTLWHAGWIGEMFRWGADQAQQWNIFDLMAKPDPDRRRSGYWAFWLWANAMGDTLVHSNLDGVNACAVYSTRSEHGLHVMVINQSADAEAKFEVALKDFAPAARGQEVRFTRRELLWLDTEPGVPGHEKRSGVWNTGPTVRNIPVGRSFKAVVPPASIVVYQIPAAGRAPVLTETKPPAAQAPRLELVLPDEMYAGDAVEAWAVIKNGSQPAPYPLPVADGRIRLPGHVKADRKTVRLSEAAGRFVLTSERPGTTRVEVVTGTIRTSRTVTFKPSEPKPRVYWEFEATATPTGMDSHWTLSFDGSIRPNQNVARIAVGGETPVGDDKRALLVINNFPGADRLDRSNIRGAFTDLKTSMDFRCDDPEASVQIVMQSPINWWMPLGTVKLSECKDWKTVTFLTENPAHVKAMPQAFNLWFILASKSPVHGSILIDRAGLMVR